MPDSFRHSSAFQTVGQAFETLRKNQKLRRMLKRFGHVFVYNTVHAVLISHDTKIWSRHLRN